MSVFSKFFGESISSSKEQNDVDDSLSGPELFAIARDYKYGTNEREKNAEKAYQYYLKSAEKDYPFAMLNVANRLVNGIGCSKNMKEAFNWYEKAAKYGIPSPL